MHRSTTFLIIPLACLAFLLLTGFRLFSIDMEIKGHLKKNTGTALRSIADMTILLKADGKIITEAATDAKGNFSLHFTPGKELIFDFYCCGANTDTVLLYSTDEFESDYIQMTLYAPAIVKKDMSGNIICPKCLHADKVQHLNHMPNHKTLARYYCERDHVKF